MIINTIALTTFSLEAQYLGKIYEFIWRFIELSHNFKLTPIAAITHKIFERKPSFNAKYRTTGKVYVLFFIKVLLVLTKFSLREGD